MDDDFDGDVDCADADCTSSIDCGGSGPETNCANGLDDDADTTIDCADSDCAGTPPCMPEANCANGIDDDGDTTIDCADSDCAGAPPCLPESDCTNGLDDDGDTATDCADSDCAGHPSCNDCAPLDPDVWAPPPEIARTMTVTKPASTTDARIDWTSLDIPCGPGTRYDVVSGIITTLRPDGGVVNAACIGDNVLGSTLTDSRLLSVMSDGYYYLVRGQNVCATGTYGQDSLGTQRGPGPGDCP